MLTMLVKGDRERLSKSLVDERQGFDMVRERSNSSEPIVVAVRLLIYILLNLYYYYTRDITIIKINSPTIYVHL